MSPSGTGMEAIALRADVRKALFDKARAQGLDLDEYLEVIARGAAESTARSGGSESRPMRKRLDLDGMLERMQEVAMVRMLGGAGGGGDTDPVAALREQLTELKAEMRSSREKGSDEMDKWMDKVIKFQAIKSMGGGDDKTAQAIAEERRRLEEKLEKQQETLHTIQRDSEQKLTQMEKERLLERERAMEERIHQTQETLNAMQATMNQPPPQQPSPLQQFQQFLAEQQAVQVELHKLIGQRGAPEPKPGAPVEERIAFLVDKMGEGISKGIEAFAKVKAAERGVAPEDYATMPTAAAQANPAAPAAPVRSVPPTPVAPAPPLSTIMPPLRPEYLPVEAPPERGEPKLATEVKKVPLTNLPLEVSELPKDVPFYDAEGNRISAEEFTRLRKEVIAKTGKDPAVGVVPTPPAPAPTSARAPAPAVEPSDEDEPTTTEEDAPETS